MITKSEIKENKDLLEAFREGISGGFVPIENTPLKEEDVKNYEFLIEQVRYKCTECGLVMSSKRKSEYNCHECMSSFKPRKERLGWKIVDFELENFIGDYKLKLCENPPLFADKNIENTREKYLLFSARSDENYNFIDGAGAFVELSLDTLEDIIEDEIDSEEIIEKLRQRRKPKIEWKSLVVQKRKNEMQALVYRLLEKEDNFKIESSGGRNNEGGNDGVVYYTGGHVSRRMMIQCKRNTTGSLSRKDIRNMVEDAEDHNLEGLLVAVLNISGPAMNRHIDGNYTTADVHPVFLWQEEDLERKLVKYPHLLREFFF